MLNDKIDRRAGFTLIELLVVIALMATLIGLGLAGFMRVRNGQMKSSSEATLEKLNTALDNRMSAIRESVNEDARKNQGQWPNAMAMANQNPDRAKSLLLYAKMKNELPTTFAEAKTATVIRMNAADTVFITLPARASFTTALGALTGTGTPEESAVCFYLAVMTSGGGGAMTDGDGLNQQVIDSPTFPGQKVFKDAWGKEIAFVRHAYTGELNSPPFIRAGQLRDPFDPAAKLSTFMTANAWNGIILGAPPFAPMPPTYTPAANHVGTLISAGPNKDFETSIFGGADNDNLLSYRLRREGARSD